MSRCLFLIVFACGLNGIAEETLVSEPETARKAVRDAKPGDVIVLAAGEWRDADLRLDGEGTIENPITIRAEEPGKTVFTGASRIRLGGSHLVVSGLWLKNFSGTGADLFEFRIDSKRRANQCRVTDCAFTEDAAFEAKEKECRWIGIYGADNQIDHCTISGKKNKGTSLVVWLGESDPGGHRILSNHFGERPGLGKNGGETIRIGDSKTSMMKAHCLVEGNWFFHCDGETECISNKSCGNNYRANWFVETQGTLTLRHGNDCLVEGNFFLGHGREHTGGIRVIGERHRVIGNVLTRLEGDNFRSGICLVNGIPNSPENGYLQVIDTLIRGNTISNCKDAVLVGHNDVDKATLPPKGTVFESNTVVARNGRAAVRVERAGEGTIWKANAIEGPLEGMDEVEGIRGATAEITEPNTPDPQTFGATWFSP